MLKVNNKRIVYLCFFNPELWMVKTIIFLLPISFFIQKTTLPDSSYSWLQSVNMLFSAVTDKYFLVMMVFVTLATQKKHDFLFDKYFFYDRKKIIDTFFSVVIIIFLVSYSRNYSYFDTISSPIVFFCLYRVSKNNSPLFLLEKAVAVVILLTIVSYIFTILKSQVFFYKTPNDASIVEFERLFFNHSVYDLIAKWAATHAWVVKYSDWIYYLFFHHIALVSLFLLANNQKDDQKKYITCLLLCYLYGAVSYYLYPVMGPVYYDFKAFLYLKENAPFTNYIQNFLLHSTKQAITGKLDNIQTFAFIAGMPSLHMAHESIMLLYSRKSPLMFCFSLLFWLSSLVAVLVLGWHYLTDVIAGIILAVIFYVYVNYSYKHKRFYFKNSKIIKSGVS